MVEVTIFSRETYHVLHFDGDTLVQVDMDCNTAWSRSMTSCYLPDKQYPVIAFETGMYLCVPMDKEEIMQVARTGGILKLFADDLYSIYVDGTDEIEKGFIELFYDL